MPTIAYPTTIRQPIWSSSKDVQAKVLKNEYGDNYTERASDGINSIKETWNISWTNLTTVEKNAIETFLRERAGWQAFSWNPFGEGIKKYTCDTWKFTPTQAGYWNGSGIFSQVFDFA